MQQTGGQWREEHCSGYLSRLTTKNHDLPDAVAFAYEGSISVSPRLAKMSLQKYLVEHDGDLDGDAAKESWLSKKSESEKREQELSASMLETGNRPEND